MQQTHYNERSWAIDLASDINEWARQRNVTIRRAGGEFSLRDSEGSLFPDLLLFGDDSARAIIQGWELKFPDTPVHDPELISNAKRKARALGLNSFCVWNVACAVLYRIDEHGREQQVATWNDLADIARREDVQPNRQRISQMLYRMLGDLAGFFQSGVIQAAPLLDALTGEGLIGLLLQNSSVYADALRDRAHTDVALEDEVTLWWLATKLQYPDESDKWYVLARANLVNLCNKYVFAHLLKRYHQAAYAIDTIGADATPQMVYDCFVSISEEADFWNVFGEGMIGGQYLPDSVHRAFLQFHALLRELQIDGLPDTLRHDLLQQLIARNKRRVVGQFATPPALAALLARLTISDATLQAIDPCTGTGTIARAIYDLKASKRVPQPLETTWASDKFALPLQFATLALTRPEHPGAVLNVFRADITDLAPNMSVKLHDPYTGASIERQLPKFDYVLSNLPFVQQEDVGQLNPTIKDINETICRDTGTDLELAARSDLLAYLPFYIWRLLKEGGTLGIIIANSWLGTAWGAAFARALTRYYDLQAVITSGKGRWFQNAKVVGTILLLRRRSDPALPPAAATQYVTLKKSLAELADDPDAFDAVRAYIHRGQDDDNEYVRIITHPLDDAAKGLPQTALFTDLSWLANVRPHLVRLGSLMNIARGERRGCDALFLPADPTGIDEAYLRPVLKRPRSLSGLRAEPDGWAFCCAKSEDELAQLGHTKTLRWIESFAHRTNEKGVPLPQALNTRAHLPWYGMDAATTADFVTAINAGDRLFFGKFDEPTFVNQRLIRVSRSAHVVVDRALLHALLNSVLGMFYLEALGFGRGEGVLDLNAAKLKEHFMVLDPASLSQEQVATIAEAFEPLMRRPIYAVHEELRRADRQHFDRTVLQAYGLQDSYDAIRRSLQDLYAIRTAVKQ